MDEMIHVYHRAWAEACRNFFATNHSVFAFYYPKCENIIIIRDFNMAVVNDHLNCFIQTFARQVL